MAKSTNLPVKVLLIDTHIGYSTRAKNCHIWAFFVHPDIAGFYRLYPDEYPPGWKSGCIPMDQSSLALAVFVCASIILITVYTHLQNITYLCVYVQINYVYWAGIILDLVQKSLVPELLLLMHSDSLIWAAYKEEKMGGRMLSS